MTGRHVAADAVRVLQRLVALNVPLGISLNDDWANLASDAAEIVDELQPLIMGIQEGFRRRYRHDLGQRWGTRQVHDSDAKAGVAVVWDRHHLHRIGRSHNPARLGGGWQLLDKTPGLRGRGVVWQDLAFDLGDPLWKHTAVHLPYRFRLASWHRDPQRDRAHWPEFDRPAVRWLQKSPLPTIVFQDGNEHGGPTGIMHLLGPAYGWHAHADSIDGAIAHDAFHVGPVVERPRHTSDHNAAVLPLGQNRAAA